MLDKRSDENLITITRGIKCDLWFKGEEHTNFQSTFHGSHNI